MPLTVQILGSFDVARDGVPVGPAADSLKPRALLALLIVRANTVVSKASLIDDLWAEPPAYAKNLIEKYVSRWRKFLDPGRLETVGRGYRLRLSAAECDRENLRALLAEAELLARQGWRPEAATVYGSAFGLWRAGDVEAFAAGLLPGHEAGALVDLYLCTLEAWAAEVLAAGDEPAVIEPLRRAWNRHPFRERLAELLLWGYAQRGQQAEATGVYLQTCRRLAEELGQDPSPALRDMHARVLRQDDGLAARAAPSPAAARMLTNLPARTRRFIGRAAELAAIEEALRRDEGHPSPSAVAIWGGVGIGKTALTLEYAYRHRDRYRLIWHVNAPTHTSLSGGLQMLAERLGVTVPPDQPEFRQLLADRLECRRPWLLIFDNAARPAALAPVWPVAPGGDILVTSLNPDWGQQAVPLQLRVLTNAETLTFLRERTGVANPVGDRALARELDGLPLACEQAASYMRQTGMSTVEYLSLFRRRRTQLLQRGTPDDHLGTIETTWRLAQAELSTVSPAAVELLQLCAHLAAEDVPLELLRAGAAELPVELRQAVREDLALEDAIRAARTYSLLGRDGECLRMHCLLQAVVSGSLPAEEGARWRVRVARLLVGAAPEPSRPPAEAAWSRLVPHVAFAARALRGHDELVPGLLDLTHRTAEYLVARGSFGDARELLETTLTVAGFDPDDPAAAPTMILLGEVLERVPDLNGALAAHERALALLPGPEGVEDPWMARASSGIVRVLTCHDGVALWQSAARVDAEERVRRALSTLEQVLGPDHPVVAQSYSGLGQIRQDLGDIAGGVACQETALQIIEKVHGPEHPDAGHLRDKLGYALGRLGEHDRAERCHLRALEILRAGYGAGHVETGWPLSNLGLLMLDAGRLDESIAYQRQARDLFAGAAGQQVATQICGWRLGRAHLAAGRPAQAVRLLAEAVPVLRAHLGDEHDDTTGAAADLNRARAAAGAV